MENLSDGQALWSDSSRCVRFPTPQNANSVAPFSGPSNCQCLQASLYQGSNLNPSQIGHPDYGACMAATGSLSLPSYPHSSYLSGIQTYPNLRFNSSTNQVGKECNLAARHQRCTDFSSVCDFSLCPITGIFQNQRRCFPSQCDFRSGNAMTLNMMQQFHMVSNSPFLSKAVPDSSQKMNQVVFHEASRPSCTFASDGLAQKSFEPRFPAEVDNDFQASALSPKIASPSLLTSTCSSRSPDLASHAMDDKVYQSRSTTEMFGENCHVYSSEHDLATRGIHKPPYISPSSGARATLGENQRRVFCNMENTVGLQSMSEDTCKFTIQSPYVGSSLVPKTVQYDRSTSLFQDAMSQAPARADSTREGNSVWAADIRACSPCKSCPAADTRRPQQEALKLVDSHLGNYQHLQSSPSFTHSGTESYRCSTKLDSGMMGPKLHVIMKERLNSLGSQGGKKTEVKQVDPNQDEIRRHSLWHHNMTSSKPIAYSDTSCNSCVYEPPNLGQELDKFSGESCNADIPVQTSIADGPGDEAWTDSGDSSSEGLLMEDTVEHVSTEDMLHSTTLPQMTCPSGRASIPLVPGSSGEKGQNEASTFVREVGDKCTSVSDGAESENLKNENSLVNLVDGQIIVAESSETIPQGVPVKILSMKYSKKAKTNAQVVVDSTQCVVEGDRKRWKCNLCEKSYTTKNNLVIHMLDHQGVKRHQCPTCGHSFRQLGHLNTHILTHDNTKPHTCGRCGKGFTQASHLKRHQVIHGRASNVCDRCQRTFTYHSDLQAHKKRYGKKPCVSQCTSETSAGLEPSVPEECRSAADSKLEGQSYEQCDKVLGSTNDLKPHDSEWSYACSDCGLNFSKECYLKAHQLTHSGIKQFKCDSCGRGFHQKANMERHRLIHRASRAFECEVCHKSFTQLQVLKAHQVTHSKKKPFQCQLCGRDFSRLYNLQGHMHIHNNSKPYSCFCGNSFTLRGNLTRHRKAKHGLGETTENMEAEAVQLLKSFSERAKEEKNQITNNTNGLTNVSQDSYKKAAVHLNKDDSKVCDKGVSKISVSLLETENGCQISNDGLSSRCFTKGVLGLLEISPGNKIDP